VRGRGPWQAGSRARKLCQSHFDMDMESFYVMPGENPRR
jgi:hypothetical protein